MKRWRLWLGLPLLFLSGVFVGVHGALAWFHHQVRAIHGDGGAFERLLIEGLDVELDLTEAQREEVAGILRDVHLELHRFKVEHHERIEEILAPGLDRMEAALRTDQRPSWAPIRAAIEEHVRAGVDG